jgi:hypothetical protein
MLAAGLAALPAAVAACAGPPMVTPIDGEPVCPDFEVGAAHSKMTGGMRFPVQVTLKDGSNVLFKGIISGRREEKDAGTRILLSDDDATLTVEWAQCANERAPRPADATGRDPKATVKYECGEATVYKTDQLVTKKGDPKSHALTFVAPPNAACWQSVAPPPAAADAGAPDAAPPPASADADAGADTDAGTDAGAEAADAGADAAAASADGGASDAWAGDAGPAGATTTTATAKPTAAAPKTN